MSGRKQKFMEKHGIAVTNQLLTASEPKVNDRKASPITYILEQQKFRSRQDILTLNMAIEAAENTNNYNREELHRIYKEISRDPNLTAQWESRKMKTKTREFKVLNQAGDEDERTKVLESPWFYSYIDAVLDAQLWGFRLIEFGDLVDGEFKKYKVGKKLHDPITIIEPDNVKPEFGVITNVPGEMQGVAFDDPRFGEQLMFIGEAHNFGILYKCCKYILFKDNCLSNWSEWAEVFGMDKRVGYTNANDEPGAMNRTNFIKALRDLGSNSYGVFAERDRIEYIGSQRTDAFKVYSEMIEKIDSSVSTIIWGQDVVSNNTGQVIGKTGENVSNMYGDADAKLIKYHVNTVLFPFMENLGFSWKGANFIWDSTEKLGLVDRIAQDKIINDMGFKHPKEYINETYGTEVEDKPEPVDPMETAQKIKNMYSV
jgi:hypothetical protein